MVRALPSQACARVVEFDAWALVPGAEGQLVIFYALTHPALIQGAEAT